MNFKQAMWLSYRIAKKRSRQRAPVEHASGTYIASFVILGLFALILAGWVFTIPGATIFGLFFLALCTFSVFCIIRLTNHGPVETDEETLYDIPESESMNPREFQQLVADMFRGYGYKVVEMPYQGDHGVDLKVIKPDEYAIVQCKMYTGNVGEPVVRDFFGAMHHEGVDNGYIVTTSGFTVNAYKWAKGKRIILVDGNALDIMLKETSITK